MEQALKFAEAHFPLFVETLKTLTRIPSISFPGFPPEPLENSATAVLELFRNWGLENCELLRVPGSPPSVYADWIHAPGKPTLLLYAHHDVQPVGVPSRWISEPFKPEERDGRLWGRGAADDKAGILVHAAAIHSYLSSGKSLPVNVKLLIEGEEEVGSTHLYELLQTYKEKLKSDILVLTDTSNFDVGIPTITTSLRGIVAVTVQVRSIENSIHSGMWGGPIPDPVQALAKILASLSDDEGRLLIPGIYDSVRSLSAEELQSIRSLKYQEETLRTQAKLLPDTQVLDQDTDILTTMTRLPSVVVTTLHAGDRAAPANALVHAAWARVTLRTVPDMDENQVFESLKAYLLSVAPWGVRVEIEKEGVAPWWLTEPKGPVYEKAAQALSEAYGRNAVFIGLGGSIPFAKPFSDVLKAPAVLIGIEDPHTNAHGENESLHLGDFKKSILGMIRMFQAYSTLPLSRTGFSE